MAYTAGFDTVSTVGLDSSLVAAALVGLAGIIRGPYFKIKGGYPPPPWTEK
jgi:hypothetical protein